MLKKIINNIRNKRIERKFEKFSDRNHLPILSQAIAIQQNKWRTIQEYPFTKSLWRIYESNDINSAKDKNDCILKKENVLLLDNKCELIAQTEPDHMKGYDRDSKALHRKYSGSTITSLFTIPIEGRLSIEVRFDEMAKNAFEGICLLVKLTGVFRTFNFSHLTGCMEMIKISSQYDSITYDRLLRHIDMKRWHLFEIEFIDRNTIHAYIDGILCHKSTMMDSDYSYYLCLSNWIKLFNPDYTHLKSKLVIANVKRLEKR